MTLEQFRTLDPGTSFIMLYHLNNVVSAINVDIRSCENLNVAASLKELNKITITVNGSRYTTDILEIQTKSGYYHFLVQPFTVDDVRDINDCTVTSLSPGINQVNFSKSEYEALKNNASAGKRTSFIFDVDRKNTQLRPQNYQAILSGSATPAEYQELNYTSEGLSNSRYGGSKTSLTQYGVESAVSGTPFQAAVYLSSEDNTFICQQSLSDRDIEVYLFTGTAETPSVGSKVFSLEKNKIIPLRNRKVWVKESRQVITLDSSGIVEDSVVTCSV